MVERRLDGRHGIWAAALLVGTLLFWVALHCEGADWFISETNADVAYTSLRRFGGLPYFSWIFNGGSYFLQDPQSSLFSLSTPVVLLAGPSVGLRLFEGLWGAAGVLGFAFWLRRRVSTEAALIGAVAGATALGVLWRIAVGNDMFLWHLGLPLLLLTVEQVMKVRSLESALWFGLTLGVMMLGPTFHSFTYLFLPVVPLFVLVEWAFERPSAAVFARTVGLFALACSIALAMISFKLAAWLKFPMERLVYDFGVIPFRTALAQLFDYSSSQSLTTTPTRFVGKAYKAYRGWGTEEGSTALAPLASILAVIGIGFGFTKKYRRTAVFAALALTLGLLLSSCSPVWEGFQALNGGNFRVAQRCLGMAAFALSLFAALGADAILSRLRRGRAIATGVVIATLMASVVWWVRSASRHVGTDYGDTVHPSAMNPVARWRHERAALAAIDRFKGVRPYRERRDVLDGYGYSDGFLIVGNDYNKKLYAPGRRSEPPDPTKRVLPFVLSGLPRDRVAVDHLRIRIKDLPKKAQVTLRVRDPRFGLVVKTTPPDAKLSIQGIGDQVLQIENQGNEAIERIVIRAALPISVAWFVLSGVALFGTIAGLFYLESSRRRTDDAQPVGGTQPLESL